MKNLVKALFVLAVSAFVLTSCNKEKAAVKKLEGTWTVEDMGYNFDPAYTTPDCGGTVDSTTTVVKVTFEAYTVGEAESGMVYGETTYTTPDTTTVFRDTSSYAVSEDGKELTITPNGGTAEVFIIDELSKSSAQLTAKNSQTLTLPTDCNGATSDYTATEYIKLSK